MPWPVDATQTKFRCRIAWPVVRDRKALERPWNDVRAARMLRPA